MLGTPLLLCSFKALYCSFSNAHLSGHPGRFLDRGLSTPKQACKNSKISSRGTPTSKALVPQIADFDGESLRRCLPRIVLAIAGALSAGGRVYVHCTAGLGRAPAACIAWRYWFDGMQLDEVSCSSCNSLSPSSWAYTSRGSAQLVRHSLQGK